MAQSGPDVPINLFGYSQYDGQTTFFYDQPAKLSQAWGWGLVLLFGAVFAVITTTVRCALTFLVC